MKGRVPLTVITGPLGAGKTTLLNRILAVANGTRIAVVESEFGREAVAQDDVVATEEEVVELPGGAMRGDLLRVLARLVRRRSPPDRVIIEAAGGADTAAIVRTVLGDGDL